MSIKKEKEKFRIGEFLKENKAIFNYIYDKNGVKQGIIMAFPSELKGKCKIGWALFEEVCDTKKDISKFKDLPKLREKLKGIQSSLFEVIDTEDKNSIARQKWISLISAVYSLEDFHLGQKYSYYYPKEANDWKNLFNLAKSRVNYDSWNYYCAKGTTLEKTDLRKDYIYTISTENTSGFITSNSEKSASIRKAVRKMEFRAWRYFRCRLKP